MSDIIERLRRPMPRKCDWIVRDYDDGRVEGPFDPLRLEAADLIERLTSERDSARREALEAAAAICDKQSAYFRGLASDRKCVSDIRWNSPEEARHTMQAYAERHETDAAAIRAMNGETA